MPLPPLPAATSVTTWFSPGPVGLKLRNELGNFHSKWKETETQQASWVERDMGATENGACRRAGGG